MPKSPPFLLTNLLRRLRKLARYRLAAAIMAPMLALVAFSGYVVFEKLEGYRESADLLLAAQVARTTHDLARELENERSLVALYLGTNRETWRSELDDQRALTDVRTAELRSLLMTPKVAFLFGRTRGDLGLGTLDGLRAGVDGDGDLHGMLDGYNSMISGLIVSSSRVGGRDLANLIAAYMDLGHVKDRIARERSIGSTWLLQGRRDPELVTMFVEAHAEQEAFLQSFRGHASMHQLQLFDQLVGRSILVELDHLHDRALSGKLSAADSTAWHHAHVAATDKITRASETLAGEMEAQIQSNLRSAQITFYLVVAGVVALVTFSLETLRRSERRATIAEEEARKLFRAVEQSPVSVMISDIGGQIEYVNPAFTRMTGFERDEVLGNNPRLLRSPLTPQSVYDDLWRVIGAGHDWRGEIVNQRRDGTVYWEQMTIAPVKGSDGKVCNYIAVKEDITTRKQAEEAVNTAREAAELANRAKSEFLATMSHELRTPLNAIIGFSEIIEQELLGPVGQSQYSDYARDINDSGKHLLQLINDILDVARLEVGRVTLREEQVDPANVVRACLGMVRERAEAGKVTLNAPPNADLPFLWADERRVKQALVNVLANAVKFTPVGGQVGVAVQTDQNGLDFVISDTGIGIAPEDLAKVMAPFGQVDSGMARRYEGSGLGLPLSRNLMELHGGILSLNSTLGTGTAVTLHFPAERLRPRV
ncbi:MAG: nitrate- and nitrite sensing domain-containing protein [Magnetospirillum sp.]|nr:nitrate- and nitrite sensing domain-containing protein [Magnetospirillum sp.]